MLKSSSWLLCIGVLLPAVHAMAADPPVAATAEGIQFFEAKIRPVLIDQCYRCHSADGSGVRGGLAVDSRDALIAGGESGPAVVPGNLEDSLLWNAINYRDFRMPPKNPLSKEVIEDFRKWIEMGAPDPRILEAKTVHSKVTAEDIEEGKKFWAFAAPKRTRLESAQSGSAWAQTEIDRFIEAKWREHDLKPTDDAEAFHVARRLYFDLIGLPPTAEETAAFSKAYKSEPAKAIKQTADELMARPQFGERWGRHWLDVVRYAESTGKEVDMSFANAWRYRNYVIDSFNEDEPYDQFIREQIAGDLLPAKDDATWTRNLIATGFLAMGTKALIEQNPRQFRADLIDEQIDATTRVFLGISVACARCHDHKFDPIPQTDYYALAGIFESTETYFGGFRSQRNRQPSRQIILPINDPNPSDKPIAKAELAELKKQLEEREKEYREARRAQNAPAAAKDKDSDQRRNFINVAVLDQMIASLNNRINSVDAEGNPLTFCMGVQESNQPRDARVLVRGEIDQPAQSVPRGFVQVLCSTPAKLNVKASGRLDLAKWLSNRENPLTARVMVNRVWQHLLGKPLVREPDNFGASGPGATHPELLDHLALQFMDHNWSVKELIREIVTSRVYRLSSEFTHGTFEKDPDNFYLARANVRRLDAEAMRDSMLAISGLIDLKRPKASMIAEYGTTIIGPNGPVMIPPGLQNLAPGEQPNPAMLGALRAFGRGGSNPLEAPNYNRSVYLPIVRNALPRSLDVFDFAEPSLVVGEREVSHTADQALYMLNNPFVIELSESVARRVLKQADQPAEMIQQAFRIVHGRNATDAEAKAAGEFMRREFSLRKDSDVKKRNFAVTSQLCQALMASAEFRFVN